MTASKPTKRPVPLAAQFLKLVGVLLLLTFFVEWGILFVSPQLSNHQWQLTVLNQFIERGVTPLIGFVFIYTGFWIQAVSGHAPPEEANSSALIDWRFWVFVLSSLLGLMCLLAIPLYLSITGQITEQAVNQINQEAAQAEIRIDQEQRQIKQLASSGQLNQILQSGQLPAEQRALLQQLQNDPKALERQAGQARERIRTQQQEAVARAQQEAVINRLRVSLRSFLLAIGFISIGWSGLREHR